jgi:hypothetical protein
MIVHWGLNEFVDSQPLVKADPDGRSGWIPFSQTPDGLGRTSTVPRW